MSKLLFLILSLSVFLAACEDPAANKPKATTINATTNTTNSANANTNTSTSPAVAGVTLAVTPENSKISFTGSKVTGKHEGGFNKFTGTINLVNDKAEDSGVTVEIDMSSVYTDTDAVTKHLQTGDFFEVEKFPTANFKSTKIVPDTAKGAGNFIVTGDLTLHGVTKSISFPATITVNAETVAVNAEFSINRKDFGIVYAGKPDNLIRDDVVIKLELKAPRKK
jgi:polyisoprenoid-binding protein YceI